MEKSDLKIRIAVVNSANPLDRDSARWWPGLASNCQECDPSESCSTPTPPHGRNGSSLLLDISATKTSEKDQIAEERFGTLKCDRIYGKHASAISIVEKTSSFTTVEWAEFRDHDQLLASPVWHLTWNTIIRTRLRTREALPNMKIE